MPRKPRLHYPGALNHVISRGNNRQTIFTSELDYETFLLILKKTKSKYPFFLYAYCLMPNHFHLLVEVINTPLSIIMQRLLTTYTFYFNRTYHRNGHLFQGRYKAILVDKDSYLLELVRYIHLNPFRAKIVKTPSNWKWSGHVAYLGKITNSILDQQPVLNYFSQRLSSARTNYVKFVRDGLTIGRRSDFYPEEKLPYLGKDKFIEDHKLKHEELIGRTTPGSPINLSALNVILERVCMVSNVESTVIQGNSRLATISKVRQRFIKEAYRIGHRAADIARFLNRTQAFISKIVSCQR